MIPENEQGVIVEFAKCAERHGFDIVSIQSAFPDAIISKEGIEYRAEFEFAASNFRQHGHDVRKCDLVICWLHDVSGFVLPVLALENPDWPTTSLALPSDIEREVDYWKHRALSAEAKLRLASSQGAQDTHKAKPLPGANTRAAILDHYRANPLASERQAAKALATSHTTVGNWLDKLETAGKIHRNGHGVEVL